MLYEKSLAAAYIAHVLNLLTNGVNRVEKAAGMLERQGRVQIL